MQKNKAKNKSVTKADLTEFGEDLKRDLKRDLRKEINEDFKSHIGTLYEKFNGDIKLVIEGQSGMNQRLERVETKVDLLTETVGDIKVELTGHRMELDNKVDRSEHKGLERRVVALEAKV